MDDVILSSLINNREYANIVLPFLKKEYFKHSNHSIIYEIIEKFYQTYSDSPDKNVLMLEIESKSGLKQEQYDEMLEIVESLDDTSNNKLDWLVDKTERFCKEQAIHNAIMESVEIYESNKAKQVQSELGKIEDLISKALSVSFDTDIGHDYLVDYQKRLEYYYDDVARIPWSLDIFNEVTNGGIPRKTFNCYLAPTHVGKTAMMCSDAMALLRKGFNVLYISGEMSELQIGERFDANMLKIKTSDLFKIDKDFFTNKMSHIASKCRGKLVTKQFPTSEAHTGHFDNLMQELKLKKNFIPDVVFVDYINLFCSRRGVKAENSYSYIRAIAEEMRGFAIKHDIVLWTATQTNRTGSTDQDPDMTTTADSFGLPMIADLFWSLIRTPELDSENKLLVKQQKNRYMRKDKREKFVIGVDIDTMTFYDIADAYWKDAVDMVEDADTKVITGNSRNNFGSKKGINLK